MKLFVKAGKEYVLGGKVYRAGQQVEVPDKFAAVLTSAKGPLQSARPARGPNKTDLPKQETASAPLDRRAGNYSTRVMTPDE